jgi:hypothetical protein
MEIPFVVDDVQRKKTTRDNCRTPQRYVATLKPGLTVINNV